MSHLVRNSHTQRLREVKQLIQYHSNYLVAKISKHLQGQEAYFF